MGAVAPRCVFSAWLLFVSRWHQPLAFAPVGLDLVVTVVSDAYEPLRTDLNGILNSGFGNINLKSNREAVFQFCLGKTGTGETVSGVNFDLAFYDFGAADRRHRPSRLACAPPDACA